MGLLIVENIEASELVKRASDLAAGRFGRELVRELGSLEKK